MLAPLSFLSAYEKLVLPNKSGFTSLKPLGSLINGTLLYLGKLSIRSWSEPVRRLRDELGLPRGKDPLFEGQHSPHLVLALFSKFLLNLNSIGLNKLVLLGFLFMIAKKTQNLPQNY